MNMYDTVLKVDDANAENKCLVASIVNIKEANYSREFKGVGYVKLMLGETVTYMFADNNNNVASISARATEYLANSEIVSALAAEQIAILNTYAGVVAE